MNKIKNNIVAATAVLAVWATVMVWTFVRVIEAP